MTRLFRISAAQTWVNDLCASCQTRSLHNPAPANRRRDHSDPIGVVSTNIFGTPGRGGAVVEIWSDRSSGFIMAVVPRKKTTKLDGTICRYGGRSRNDRKAKSCETLSDFFLYIRLLSSKILPYVWKTCMQRGPSAIGNALALFRVCSTAQVAASSAAGLAFRD